ELVGRIERHAVDVTQRRITVAVRTARTLIVVRAAALLGVEPDQDRALLGGRRARAARVRAGDRRHRSPPHLAASLGRAHQSGETVAIGEALPRARARIAMTAGSTITIAIARLPLALEALQLIEIAWSRQTRAVER